MPELAIPSGDQWSLASGLEFISPSIIQLARQVFTDDFSDDIINPKIGTITANGGTVTEASSKIHCDATGGANEAAAIFAAQKIVLNSDEIRTFKHKWDYNAPLQINFILHLQQYAGTPTALNQATRIASRTVQFWVDGNSCRLVYIDKNGVLFYWNPATGAWQTGAVIVATLSAGTSYIVVFEYTQSVWRLRLRDGTDSSDIFTAPTWVSWDVIRDIGDDYYIITGDLTNDTYICNMDILEIIGWDDGFLDTSPVATSPWFPIDQTTLDATTAIAIALALAGAATVKFQWALNNGAFNGSWLTLAQLITALNGQSITNHTNSMRLKAQFNSNGEDQAKMHVPATRVNADLVYVPADEADVLLDVQYGTDGTEFTGTLLRYAVPTNPGDTVRQRIMDVVETRMGTILTSNGYKTNAGQNVYVWREEGIAPAKRPAIEIRDVDVEKFNDTIGEVENHLTVQISISTAESASAMDQLRDIASDVVKAVGTDVNWSALAQDTELIAEPTDIEKLTQKALAATLSMVIIFITDRHSDFAPA